MIKLQKPRISDAPHIDISQSGHSRPVILKRLWGYCIIMLSLTSLYVCPAQSEQMQLTLNQALNKAITYNNDLKKASYTVTSSGISVNQAKSAFLPYVNAGAGWTGSLSGRQPVRSGSTSDINVSAGLTVFDGFSRTALLQNARSSYMANMSTMESQRQLVLYTVFSYYVQAALDSEVVRIQTENLNSQNKQLEQIEAYYKSGQKSLGDVLTQKATTAKAELSLVNAKLDYNVAKLTLVKYIGEDSLQNNIDVIITPFDTTHILLNVSQDTSITLSIDRRKDIEAQRHEIEAAEASIKSAKSSYWPTVALSAGASSSYSPYSPNSAVTQLSDKNLNASLGISLSVPIFDKFSAKYNVASAKVTRSREEDNLRELKRQVIYEIRDALLNYHAAEEQVRVTQTEVESAKQALDAVSARYEVGAATLTDLTISRSDYLTSLNDRAQAISTLALKTVAVGYYCGAIPEIIAYYDGTVK
ncbi:MAG TPA: hypothetical protein DCO75_00750 [Fibrobacteres bacterium]|nr:hypothetical protein [Fibrobacterota bacterium]